jgi:hypothetical protein
MLFQLIWITEIVLAVAPCEPVVVPECECDNDCNDGLFCTGTETCADGTCVAGETPCNQGEVCVEDVDQCVELPPPQNANVIAIVPMDYFVLDRKVVKMAFA